MAQERALLKLGLPSRPGAPSAARKALTALNGSLHLVSEERLRDAQLLLSELVANAVRHGSRATGEIGVAVRATPASIRVEVSDEGGGFDPTKLAPPSPDTAGGWGLPIVAALAHRWGVDRGSNTVVWFEIDRPQRDAPVQPSPSRPEVSYEDGRPPLPE